MTQITPKDIAALRQATGAGMLDCKNALAESEGNLESAKEWLRKKGLSSAAKRAGREANEGAVEVYQNGSVATLVELNCETDFVAKGSDFGTALSQLCEVAANTENISDLNSQEISGEKVEEYITQLGAKLGENITLGRTNKFVAQNGVVDAYKHLQSDRGVIGVLVRIENVDSNSEKAKEVAHDIALHIASAAPQFLKREDVSEEDIAKERKIIEEMATQEGKPAAAVEKIVEGRMNGFFKDACLLEQQFVKDNSFTIKQLVESISPEAELVEFARIKIGE